MTIRRLSYLTYMIVLIVLLAPPVGHQTQTSPEPTLFLQPLSNRQPYPDSAQDIELVSLIEPIPVAAPAPVAVETPPPPQEAPPVAVAVISPQTAVQQAAVPYGWHVGAEWDSLLDLVNRESSWNPVAQNPTSTAYGLFQFLDSTWELPAIAAAGCKKSADAAEQARCGLIYIQKVYATPSAALNFWVNIAPTKNGSNWY